MGAGLAHFGDEAGGLQAEEIDFLRLTGYRDEMTGSGSGSPKIRLDLVEFELRHLKVSIQMVILVYPLLIHRSMWRSSSLIFWR